MIWTKEPAFGRGGTSSIGQHDANSTTTLAFKLSSKNFNERGPRSAYKALISEVLVLGIPALRQNLNIVHLEGICWEVHLGGSYNSPNTIYPVLVSQRANRQDLKAFFSSQEGIEAGFDTRVEICTDISHGIMALHGCQIVHGDIKPENVLISRHKKGMLHAKVADFGYSSLYGSDDVLGFPRSPFWNAPEYHERGFILKDAQRMDIYSMGLLFLFILFGSEALGLLWYATGQGSPEEDEKRIEHYKDQDDLPQIARNLVMKCVDADDVQKESLIEMFELMVVRDPGKRILNIADVVQYLNPYEPGTYEIDGLDGAAEGSIDDHRHISLSMPHAIYELCNIDYRVRCAITKSLQFTSTHTFFEVCSKCRSQVTLQLAFCVVLGFGIPKDDVSNFQMPELDKQSQRELRGAIESVKNDEIIPETPEGILHEGYYDICALYDGPGKRKIAAEQYRWEAECVEKILGPTHHVVSSLRHYSISLYFGAGMFRESEDLCTAQLGYLEEAQDTESDQDRFLDFLAVLYIEQHRWLEAERLLDKQRMKRMQSGHIWIRNHFDNLVLQGKTYSGQGRTEEAIRLFSQVLELQKRQLGPEHSSTAQTMKLLAAERHIQGKLTEAESLLLLVLRIEKRDFGQESRDVLSSMNRLGAVYRDMGRLPDAELQHLHTAKGSKYANSSLEDPDLLDSMAELGLTYQAQGRLLEAADKLETVMKSYIKWQGIESTSSIDAMSNLASNYSLQGRYAEAEELYEQALKNTEKKLGLRCVEGVICIENLSGVYKMAGKSEAAINMLRKAIDIRLEILDHENPGTVQDQETLHSWIHGTGASGIGQAFSKLAL